MGCFSWKCKKCRKPIFMGDKCEMFGLKDGKIIGKQSGIYSGYGYVEGASADDWVDNFGVESWNKVVCQFMCTESDKDGFALYHKECYNDETPLTVSEDSKSQGIIDWYVPEND